MVAYSPGLTLFEVPKLTQYNDAAFIATALFCSLLLASVAHFEPPLTRNNYCKITSTGGTYDKKIHDRGDRSHVEFYNGICSDR